MIRLLARSSTSRELPPVSAPIDHKKPTLAFVLLLVIASAIMGNALHARADEAGVAYAFATTITARHPVAVDRHQGAGADAVLTRAFGSDEPVASSGRTRSGAGHRHAGQGRLHTRHSGRHEGDGAGPLGHEGTSLGGGLPRFAIAPETLLRRRTANRPLAYLRLHRTDEAVTVTRTRHGLRVRLGKHLRIAVPLGGADSSFSPPRPPD